MGGSNLAEGSQINFGLIQFSATQGMKPHSCPSQFNWWQQSPNFQEKELSHKCSALAFVRLLVAAAAMVYQEPHFWRTEGQKLEHLCVTINFCEFFFF